MKYFTCAKVLAVDEFWQLQSLPTVQINLLVGTYCILWMK